MSTQSGQIIIPHEPQDTQGGEGQLSPYSTAVPTERLDGQVDQTPLEVNTPSVAPEQVQPQTPVVTTVGTEQISAHEHLQESASEGIVPLPEDISWTASEFIEHPKDARWYALLSLITVVLASLDYLLTRDFISTSVVVIAAIFFGIYAGRKPRVRQYRLSPGGLEIGEKIYHFQSFKAFSVIDEGATAGIVFMPLARFAPALTIYVASDMKQNILDYLTTFLPFEQSRNDLVDGLLRRIHF